MSIPLPDPLAAFHGGSDDPFDTSLITRLVAEAFHGGPRAPGALAGIPTPASVSSEPAAGSSSAITPGLPGGFPSTAESGPPPVHPSVVAPETQPAAAQRPLHYETYSGEEEQGTHEFGEPQSFLDGGFSKSGPVGTIGRTLRSPDTSRH